jgi:hypothetical protein
MWAQRVPTKKPSQLAYDVFDSCGPSGREVISLQREFSGHIRQLKQKVFSAVGSARFDVVTVVGPYACRALKFLKLLRMTKIGI